MHERVLQYVKYCSHDLLFYKPNCHISYFLPATSYKTTTTQVVPHHTMMNGTVCDGLFAGVGRVGHRLVTVVTGFATLGLVGIIIIELLAVILDFF